jgi:hypothetical protein
MNLISIRHGFPYFRNNTIPDAVDIIDNSMPIHSAIANKNY